MTVLVETRPNPLAFCLPTPPLPPVVEEENIVGRFVGEYVGFFSPRGERMVLVLYRRPIPIG